MARRTKRRARAELIAMLDDLWAKYPDRLAALPDDEQLAFARQQGYDRPQDLLAHLGAWMAETLRVMPYLLHDECPFRDYANDQQFNRRAVERFQDKELVQVETWYQKQRRALRKLIKQLPDDALSIPRVYRWLSGTIVGHYEEHPLPASPPTPLLKSNKPFQERGRKNGDYARLHTQSHRAWRRVGYSRCGCRRRSGRLPPRRRNRLGHFAEGWLGVGCG